MGVIPKVILGATLILAAMAWAANPAAAMPESLEYVMLKEGEPVGSHRFDFRRDGDALQVNVVSTSRAKVLFMNFTYDHERTEVWKGGRLVALTSKTDDDGTPHEVAMKAGDVGLDVVADGKAETLPADALPITLWNTAILEKNVLYSALDGKPFKVTVEALPDETITVRGAPVMARAYRMRGDFERDLWYAPDGTFLKTRFMKKGFNI
ncbi:MAG: DUF6134 family protein, partial [Rhodospirillales bacterium]|nr:DUF6134 family protein [Rhodospirillales bacterium]